MRGFAIMPIYGMDTGIHTVDTAGNTEFRYKWKYEKQDEMDTSHIFKYLRIIGDLHGYLLKGKKNACREKEGEDILTKGYDDI